MGTYTKQELVKRFFNICSVYGFKTITVDDLANGLGMSKKTLYQYFKSKEEIVEQVLLYFLEQLKLIINTTEESNLDVISKLIMHFESIINLFDDINQNFFSSLKFFDPKIIEIIMQFESEYYLPCLKKIFLEGVEKGVFRKDIDIEAVLLSHNNLFNLFVFNRERNENYIKLDKTRLGNLIINEVRGVTTLTGYEVLESYLNDSKVA